MLPAYTHSNRYRIDQLPRIGLWLAEDGYFSEAGGRSLLAAISAAGAGSFLAVLKCMGMPLV